MLTFQCSSEKIFEFETRVEMSDLFRPWLQEEEAKSDPDSPPRSSTSNTTPAKITPTSIGKGSKMQSQTVKIVQSVHSYMREIVCNGGVLPSKNVNKITSDATKVSVTAVKKIMNENPETFRTPTKKRVRKTKFAFDKIDDFSRDLLRRTIYDFFKNGVSPTIRTLNRAMREKTAGTEYEFPYSDSTLYRLLGSMGFVYRTLAKKSAKFESEEVIAWRYRYLQAIREFRSKGYRDLYLDETWFDTNTCKMKNWADDSENCSLKVSNKKGERIVILHCGGRNGFVKDALCITHRKMEDAPADYHGTMTASIFEEWFENSLLRRLEEPSVIVIDNAPIHSRVCNPRPNISWKKEDIVNFMSKHNIPLPDPLPIKPVLIQLIREKLGSRVKRYAIDELALLHGHVVLRLPPYHCIFNPIEQVWSEIKRRVASLNLNGRPVHDIISTLEKSLNMVNADKWQNYVRHVEQIENDYRSLQFVHDNDDRAVCVVVDNGQSSTENEESDS